MISALVYVTCDPERSVGFDRIAFRIAQFPEVETVGVISGRADLALEVKGKTMEQITHFITEIIAPMKGVTATETHFFMKMYKIKGKIKGEIPKVNRLPIAP